MTLINSHEAFIAPAVPAEFHNVMNPVIEEVKSLQAQGIDVKLVDVYDPAAMHHNEQTDFDAYVAGLEDDPDYGREAFNSAPANKAWNPLKRHALALHPLYRAGSAEVLGEGIPDDVFDRKLNWNNGNISGVSAADIVRGQKKPERAEKIIADHEAFLTQAIDENSEKFYAGSMDGRAIRTRGLEATRIVKDHFANKSGIVERQDLVSASIACGAVGPLSQLVKEIEVSGGNFEKAILVDKDPMALAAASAITAEMGIGDKVDLQLRDLLKDSLNSYIEEGSVDVADLLALVEYLPKSLAVNILSQVRSIMRPGGVVVWGNMLSDRPQQTMFADIVKWPRLQQRTISDCLEIMQEAGYELDDISATVPGEGVYAVYSIKISEKPQYRMSHILGSTLVGAA